MQGKSFERHSKLAILGNLPGSHEISRLANTQVSDDGIILTSQGSLEELRPSILSPLG